MTVTGDLLPPRPHRTQRWAWGLFIATVLLAAAVLWLLFHSARSDSRVNGLNGTVTVLQRQVAGGHDLAKQVTAACRTDDKATLARLGISCAKASSVAAQAPPSAVSGAPGRPPTAAEIRDAVTVYCAAHASCTGTPSQGQVQAAVEAFCAAGACTGAQGGTGAAGQSGAPGEPGVSGTSGQAGAQGQQGSQGDTGPQGPGPSTEEIAAAVSAFCAAHGDCTGPAGPTGATGPAGEQGSPGATGPAGRGIASIDCSGLGIAGLVIHYDDGTSATVACTLLPRPTESETHS